MRNDIEECLVYLVQSIHENPYDTLLVMDGGGCSRGAENWVKSEAGKGTFLDVVDLKGFNKLITCGEF